MIDEDTLSRAHVRFVLRAGRVLVRDLASARGTFLGAARLDPQKDTTWMVGTSLRVGSVVLSLVMPTALDEAIAEVIARAPAVGEEPKAETPTAPAQKSSAPVVASAPVVSKRRDEDRGLGVKIVVSAGVLFIAGCVVVLLWVLGVFSR